MEGLWRILRAAHCRGTHHYFALDAMRHIRTDAGHQLARLLLRHHGRYLAGARDPDTRFRDFQNHVVYVADSNWGGAPRAAERWYGRLQQFLREGSWADAAHAAGVLSHYFTDPLQPLHTAHGDREAVVHRPLEWSIFQAYDKILSRWQDDRFHVVFQLSSRADWLSSAVIKGAELAHRSYETLVGTYDLEAARRHPVQGLGDAAYESLAELFGVAITGWARVLERTADEAAGHLPHVSLRGSTIKASLRIPVSWLARRAESREESAQVANLLRYYGQTGRLGRYTPPEVALVRKVLAVRERDRQYWEEVERQERARASGDASGGDESTALRIVSPPDNDTPAIRAVPRHGVGESLRRLTLASSILENPAIGPKTAERFQSIGITNISQFLGSSPEELATRLRVRWITVEQVADWQAQTRLMMSLAWLRVRDAQLLVAVGCRTLRLLETASADVLLDQSQRYARASSGKRSLRSAPPPTRGELQSWIDAARQSNAAAA